MATVEIPALKNWKRSAMVWGAMGIGGSVISGNPALTLLVGIGMGAIAGWLAALWVERRKERLLPLVSYGGLALLIYLLLVHLPAKGLLGNFSIGAAYVAAESLVFGLLGERIVRKLNHRYRDVLDILTPKPKKLGIPEDPPDQGQVLEDFLNALPPLMQDDFRKSIAPVISLHTFRSLESLSPTHSSLGGVPLLPDGQPWPSRDGEPLDFLAQIDLSQAPFPDGHSPASGTLAFFFDDSSQPWGGDAEDLGSGAIIHCPPGAKLHTVLKPGTVPPPPLRMPVRFRQSVKLSMTEDQEAVFYSYYRSLSPEEKESLDDLHERLLDASGEYSRWLSNPARIQGAMDQELATASAAYGLPEGTAWVMLLQLDSINDLGWCWGDAGCLYFHIPAEDLAVGRFDRSWVVLQCH